MNRTRMYASGAYNGTVGKHVVTGLIWLLVWPIY